MVRAILDGRKTQTRRVIKPQPKAIITTHGFWQSDDDGSWAWCYQTPVQDSNLTWNDCRLLGNGKCPYGKVGDHLWVRETWQVHQLDGPAGHKEFPNILYRADSSTRLLIDKCVWKYVRDESKWRPSIYMPRWASRIALEITDIRVGQVQNISAVSCYREGTYTAQNITTTYHGLHCWSPEFEATFAKQAFKLLWDSLNAKRGYSWDSNPWVWVVEFKQVKETD